MLKDLQEKQSALQEVRNKVQKLEYDFKMNQQQLEQLNAQKQGVELQLLRAEKLVVGLADEAKRWALAIKDLDVALENLLGNYILAAGYISYTGVFTSKFRHALLKKWMAFLRKKKLPFDQNF